MINLFYLSGNTTGGWVTFTYHLVKVLEAMGEEVWLYKIGNRTEGKRRPFGYDLAYRNITREDAVMLPGHSVVVAAAKQQAEAARTLIGYGARVVLHDPTELRAGLAGLAIPDPWVIRKAVQRQVPGSVFIRHPYVRRPAPLKLPKRKGAVSTSRTDFDKNTTILLDANRLGAGIRIHGFENRLYTRFKICPEYPEWEQSKAHYARTPDAAYELLLGAKCMVDMSLIKGDGGGTQYTFLEAWDAGTVPIIHQEWLLPKDDMKVGENCLMAWDGQSLLRQVKACKKDTADLVAAGEKQLKKHSAKIVGPQIMEWINAR